MMIWRKEGISAIHLMHDKIEICWEVNGKIIYIIYWETQYEKYLERLWRKIGRLQEENKYLKEENKDYDRDYSQLTREDNKKFDKIQELEAQIEQLQRELRIKKGCYSCISDKTNDSIIKELNQKIRELEAQIEQLEKVCPHLKIDVATLNKIDYFCELKQQIEQMKNENSEIKEIYETSLKANMELEAQIAQLKEKHEEDHKHYKRRIRYFRTMNDRIFDALEEEKEQMKNCQNCKFSNEDECYNPIFREKRFMGKVLYDECPLQNYKYWHLKEADNK